eukprot:scaffold1169_cov367-Prasinococcus_capsulatus_cf.AAC.4
MSGEEAMSAEQHLVRLLEQKQKMQECCIIYCHKRETCDDIARHLQDNDPYIACEVYHAGMRNKDRQRVLDDFMNKRCNVVVATVAFGMGIDRDDVRIVIHWNVPKNVESFYQESGRAGRDGKTSHSLVYYSSSEVYKMEYLLVREEERKREKRESMDLHRQDDRQNTARGSTRSEVSAFASLCELFQGVRCRRGALLRFFGETKIGSLARCCDVCNHGSRKVEQRLASMMDATDQGSVRESASMRNRTMLQLLNSHGNDSLRHASRFHATDLPYGMYDKQFFERRDTSPGDVVHDSLTRS